MKKLKKINTEIVMENVPNDLYFEILKFGRDNLNKNLLTKELLFEHLKTKNIEIPHNVTEWLWSALDGTVFRNLSNSESEEFILTPVAYFQFLEHERLKEARDDTKISLSHSARALKRSTIAIWITGSLAFIQILIMLYQIILNN